jgi:predicted HTH transcriptional regulator
MTDNLNVAKMISRELAAIESHLTKLRQKVQTVEVKRDRFRAALAVLDELKSKMRGHARRPQSTNAPTQNRQAASRSFTREGITVKLVRHLYEQNGSITAREATERTGVSARRMWTTLGRLRKSGLVHRSGKKYTLTPRGIAAWQASPLFEGERLSGSEPKVIQM